MDLVELKCSNCNKLIYIQHDRLREKNFCTLGCLFKDNSKNDFLSASANFNEGRGWGAGEGEGSLRE